MVGTHQRGAFTIFDWERSYLILLEDGYEGYSTTVCEIIKNSINLVVLLDKLKDKNIGYRLYTLTEI